MQRWNVLKLEWKLPRRMSKEWTPFLTSRNIWVSVWGSRNSPENTAHLSSPESSTHRRPRKSSGQYVPPSHVFSSQPGAVALDEDVLWGCRNCTPEFHTGKTKLMFHYGKKMYRHVNEPCFNEYFSLHAPKNVNYLSHAFWDFGEGFRNFIRHIDNLSIVYLKLLKATSKKSPPES